MVRVKWLLQSIPAKKTNKRAWSGMTRNRIINSHARSCPCDLQRESISLLIAGSDKTSSWDAFLSHCLRLEFLLRMKLLIATAGKRNNPQKHGVGDVHFSLQSGWEPQGDGITQGSFQRGKTATSSSKICYFVCNHWHCFSALLCKRPLLLQLFPVVSCYAPREKENPTR